MRSGSSICFLDHQLNGVIRKSITHRIGDYAICAEPFDLANREKAIYFVSFLHLAAQKLSFDNFSFEVSYTNTVSSMTVEYAALAHQCGEFDSTPFVVCNLSKIVLPTRYSFWK